MDKCMYLNDLYKMEIIKQLETMVLNVPDEEIQAVQGITRVLLSKLDDMTPSQMLDYIIQLKLVNEKIVK